MRLRVLGIGISASILLAACSNLPSSIDECRLYRNMDPISLLICDSVAITNAVAGGVIKLTVGVSAALVVGTAKTMGLCYRMVAAGVKTVDEYANALVDNIRQSYKEREDQIDALSKEVDFNNYQAENLINLAKQKSQADHESIEKIKQNIALGNRQIDEIEAMIAYYDENIKILQEQLNKHNMCLATYQKARQLITDDSQGELTSSEQRQLAEFDRRIATLQSDIEEIRSTCANFIQERDVLNLYLTQETSAQAK